jgi:LysM repeat protein
MTMNSKEFRFMAPSLIKGIALALLVLLGMLLFHPIHAHAANEDVTIASTSASTSSVSVSGETDALAVMCQVRDSNNQIVAMTSMPVNNGSFSGSVATPALTAGGTYKIYVADYEGGNFASEDLDVVASSNSSQGSSSSGGSSGASSSSDAGYTTKPVSTKMEYTVVRGDTLSKIARNLGVTLASLTKWNYFPNINLIRPGQKIVYYVETWVKEDANGNVVEENISAPATKGGYYVVEKGDYLYKIAKKLGVTLKHLKKKNSFKNINLIYPGQKIFY